MGSIEYEQIVGIYIVEHEIINSISVFFSNYHEEFFFWIFFEQLKCGSENQ